MIIEKTKQYAIKCHADTNHTYDGQPYSVHLEMVYDVGQRFIHLIPEGRRNDVLSACWGHDLIEDARQTYNDVKKETNESIANLIYAVTNEKGKTRDERANDEYYRSIRNQPQATFVKLCDRIANVQYSKDTKSRMFESYKEENRKFEERLYTKSYKEMFDHLLTIFYGS